MSLLSLLIALAAERYLSSSAWQFNVYYRRYLQLFGQFSRRFSVSQSLLLNGAFILAPVLLCYLLLDAVGDSLIHFIVSTLILIGCFGCTKTRDAYKKYLMCAFRGEQTSCELHHRQLLQDKNLPEMGFGQLLIWLNYRYFIAIMIFFVIFGAPGALLYRLVARMNEVHKTFDEDETTPTVDENAAESEQASNESLDAVYDNKIEENDESANVQEVEAVIQFNQQILFWLDWLPVRIVAFGYMLVGHFSRALPMWLDNLFDMGKLPHQILITVAQKSEDFMIDKDDCTAEPCLLVRLAKRTLLLCLSVVAILILTGVIS